MPCVRRRVWRHSRAHRSNVYAPTEVVGQFRLPPSPRVPSSQPRTPSSHTVPRRCAWAGMSVVTCGLNRDGAEQAPAGDTNAVHAIRQ